MKSVYMLLLRQDSCHNYLDMEVSAVDTHARVRHGHVSYIQYNSALSCMMNSQRASCSKDCECQFRAIEANVLLHSIILTLEYFDDDF